MSRTWKIILILLSVVVVLVILAKIFGGNKDEKEVTLEKVERRSLTEIVSASGKIQPETEIKIQSEVSGQIIELPVKEGDVIEKGMLLVRINPDLYTSALNRADAALNSAKSNLSSSKARLAQAETQFKLQEQNLNRIKKLFEDKAVSQSEFDNATSTYETSRAEMTAARESIHSAEFSIASAEASRNEASDNLRRTTIVAPMSGTVTALTKEIGETVLGNNMMSGDVIMRISALNTMEVNVEVNESDIVRVNVGDTANVEVDAFKDQKFKGIVSEIGNTALNATSAALTMDQVTNFSVKIRILRESYLGLLKDQPASYSPFRPGMSATVKVETDRANDVLSVPIKAVTSREDTSSKSLAERFTKGGDLSNEKSTSIPDEPYTVVFVFNETTSKADLRVVETGIQNDKFIWIKSGINEGERVITGPYDEVSRKMKAGDAVKEKREMEKGESASDK